MTSDFETEVPVSDYGKQRKEDWLARLRANHDMATSAAMQAHGQSEAHRVVQAGQGGLYQHMTPQELGQAVSERQPTVGGDYYGLGRPLERNGHLSQSIAPAPSRVDLTRVHDHPGYQGREPGVSPLLAHMRGER